MDGLERANERAGVQLQEIHDILMQARGARWVMVALVGFAGFSFGGMVQKVFAFLR